MYSTTFPTSSESTENGTIYTELISHLSLGKPHWEGHFPQNLGFLPGKSHLKTECETRLFQKPVKMFSRAVVLRSLLWLTQKLLNQSLKLSFQTDNVKHKRGELYSKPWLLWRFSLIFGVWTVVGLLFLLFLKIQISWYCFSVPSSENTVPVRPTQQPFCSPLILSHITQFFPFWALNTCSDFVYLYLLSLCLPMRSLFMRTGSGLICSPEDPSWQIINIRGENTEY